MFLEMGLESGENLAGTLIRNQPHTDPYFTGGRDHRFHARPHVTARQSMNFKGRGRPNPFEQVRTVFRPNGPESIRLFEAADLKP